MTQKQTPKEFLTEAFKAIDLRQELTDYARRELYGKVKAVELIEHNIRTWVEMGNKDGLRKYLNELAHRYQGRDLILDRIIWILDYHAPQEREWFQKLLLLQP